MTIENRVQNVIRDDVRRVKAYHVQPASGLIKLDAMENPYPLPAQIAELWQARNANPAWGRYPDAEAVTLKKLLRQVFKIDARWDLLLGNGSDELIQLLITVIPADSVVLAPSPGFTMYHVISEALERRFVSVDLDDNFDLDVEALRGVFEAEQPRVVFLASPNNPTGNTFSEDRLREVIAAAPGLVVVDEAYFAFSDVDAARWLPEFDNLLVMRTLSKLGLAGLRLGFLQGDPKWISELEKLRLPYNISSLDQAAAEVALTHFELLREQIAEICAQRERQMASLAAIPGVTVFPSDANFILVRSEHKNARDVHQELKDRGILVKCVADTHPLLHNCLRITVGAADENEALINSLSDILA